MDFLSIFGFLTLATADWVIGLLTVGFLACSVLLILTVLIQRPQGGGLSGAFGGGGGAGGETAFGARTGDALTIATISFFVLWLAVAVGLVLVMSPRTVPPPTPQAVSNEGPATPGGSSGAAGEATDVQGVSSADDADAQRAPAVEEGSIPAEASSDEGPADSSGNGSEGG